MGTLIGVRREDKNRWERRVPLIPGDIIDLQSAHGMRLRVQPSPIRVYTDDEYRSAGVEVDEDLEPAPIILAVKEIPLPLIRPGKVYVYFAHVAKGQAHNMPMLRRLMDLGCSLVDYEKITDEGKRRLIFFGRHAGYAGMIETLRATGLRLERLGIPSPLAKVLPAYEYTDLPAARRHLESLLEDLARSGPQGSPRPLVFGFAGYGNVSGGAQEVLGWLHPEEIPADGLASAAGSRRSGGPALAKVVFKEEHLVRRKDPKAPFDLQEYYGHPERYAGDFERHLPHLDVLVNAIYWEPRYPRLVTREWARRSHLSGTPPRLKVIGDISCDIEGSVEITRKATEPDHPCFVYDPRDDAIHDGLEGEGLVVMAVDNLPCELPRESSRHFSQSLRGMVPALAAADWRRDFQALDLPPQLKRAVIVHRGKLTPSYEYLSASLGAVPP